jgi:thiol-disulfide isomerase/thioredoxin
MAEIPQRWVGQVCALLLAAALAWPAAAREVAQPGVSEEVRAQLDTAQKALARGDFRAARKAYEKAVRLTGGRSGEVLAVIADSYGRAGRFDDCVDAARRGLQVASTPELQAHLENRLGMALYNSYKQGRDGRDKGDKKTLDEVVGHFRKALDLSGGQQNAIRFNFGIALLAQRHDEEGVAVLKDFLEHPPDGGDPVMARRLIADPRRAREAFAPDFSEVTLSGQPVALDDLKGKVVLIDFWATWCGPCRASAPALKKLAEKMKQEPFVLLGVSTDRDEAKLRGYLAREAEPWPQLWDQAGRLSQSFHVSGLPTFLLLDGDGRIVFSTRGWGPAQERELGSAVGRAVDQLRSDSAAKSGKG